MRPVPVKRLPSLSDEYCRTALKLATVKPCGPSHNCLRDRNTARSARRPRTNARAAKETATQLMASPKIRRAVAASILQIGKLRIRHCSPAPGHTATPPHFAPAHPRLRIFLSRWLVQQSLRKHFRLHAANSQPSNCGSVVAASEDRRTGNNGVGAGGDRGWGVPAILPAIYFDPRVETPARTQATQVVDLWQHLW